MRAPGVLRHAERGTAIGAKLPRQELLAPPARRRFVFLTGDIAALEDAARELGEIPVLTKPFTASDVDRVLGDVEVGV